MKHRATIDLELTNGDIFEKEVLDAMQSYAKTIARKTFQDEIKENVVDVAKVWTKRLFESRYSEPMTDKLVKDEVQSYIKGQMSHKDVLDLIQGVIQTAVNEYQEKAKQYVESEVERYLTSAFVINTIQKEIEKTIPKAVLDVLKMTSVSSETLKIKY